MTSLSHRIQARSNNNVLTPNTNARTLKMLHEVQDKITQEIKQETRDLELPQVIAEENDFPEPPVLTRQFAYNQPVSPPQPRPISPEPDLIISQPLDETVDVDNYVKPPKKMENFKHVIFIADFPFKDKCTKSLSKFQNIREYDKKTFTNRDFTYLRNQNINYIWFNIADRNCRKWLQTHLKVHDGYKVCSIYTKSNQKWIKDIEKYVDVSVKKKNINELSYISLGELVGEIEQTIAHIHPAATGCFKQLLFASRVFQNHQDF